MYIYTHIDFIYIYTQTYTYLYVDIYKLRKDYASIALKFLVPGTLIMIMPIL